MFDLFFISKVIKNVKIKAIVKNTFYLHENEDILNLYLLYLFHFSYKPSEEEKHSLTGIFHDATEIVVRA